MTYQQYPVSPHFLATSKKCLFQVLTFQQFLTISLHNNPAILQNITPERYL